METEQDVRLEIAAAVQVDAYCVMRFIQELKDVPRDAWCEVRNVWPARQPAASAAATISTIVQLACESRVADFLCQRFARQTRHVSQGEVLLVRCRREFLRTWFRRVIWACHTKTYFGSVQGSLPLAGSTQRLTTNTALSALHTNDPHVVKGDGKCPPTALSRATMVDLLDCLGDQIVDVLDAFQAFSEPGENDAAQLTMVGLVRALDRPSKQEWSVASNPRHVSHRAEAKPSHSSHSKRSREVETKSIDRLAIHKVRHLLSQLVANGAVAKATFPEKNDVPFMVYTDFIACYVAYMNSSAHASASSLSQSQAKPGAQAWVSPQVQTAYQQREPHTTLSAENLELRTGVAAMGDAFDSAMDLDFSSSHNNNSTKSVRRKTRRSSQLSELCGDPAFDAMFLAVGELASRDEGLTVQRSEREERRSGPTAPPGQRQRSRASRSSGAGISKKKSTTLTGTAPSVTKRDSTQSGAAIPSDDVFLRETTILARQQLTSSASRVRPVKQQQQQQQPKAGRTTRPSLHQVTVHATGPSPVENHPNNNDDNDEPIVEQAGGRAGRGLAPSLHHFSRAHADWGTVRGVHQAGALPTRSRQYLNHSVGCDPGAVDPAFPSAGSDEGDSPLGRLHADRPPSRQCHAFPTHLLDPRDFFSPNKHQIDNASAISMTPWHADVEVDAREEDGGISPLASGPEDDSGTDVPRQTSDLTNQRPPSRYMVKAARGGTSSSDKSSASSPGEETPPGRLPSRRGAAGSRNQASMQYYHDPKTDGFLEVDESVPPPFRVEISTDSNRGQYVAAQHHRVDEERRHGLKSRRTSSFGSRSQLKNLQQQEASYGQLEEASSERDAKASSARNRLLEPQWFQELEPPSSKRTIVDEPTPAARHSAATRSSHSIVQPPVSLSSDNNAGSTAQSTHQWFRSINNPFFVSPPVPTGVCTAANMYDDMDAETAIANTPLFAGEDDLMAMTQLTDLHLDDFMGDPSYVYNSSSVGMVVNGAIAGGVGTTTGSASLRTSLGRDFLSLFAQH